MRFSTPLVPATLVKRYKRFLADCRLLDGSVVTAHCANPGSMMGLAEEGARIWLEPNDDPRKKLKFGWRLVEHAGGHFTGVDTSVPNRLLREILLTLPEFADYDALRAEVPYAEKSRVDFLLSGAGQRDAFVEVKSVTLSRRSALAEFPDSVTARGARHLADLAAEVAKGNRAVLFFLVQRTDAQAVAVARDLDPTYAAAFDAATAAGVEVICYDTLITPEAIRLGRRLPLQV